MKRSSILGLLWLALLLCGPRLVPRAQAQTVLTLLTDDSEEDSEQQKRGIIPTEGVEKRLKDVIRLLRQNLAEKQQAAVGKQLKETEQILLKYQSYPKRREWRRDAEILKRRAAIARQVRVLSGVLLKLQTTYGSIEQHNIELRNALKTYLDARKTLEKLIPKKYPITKRKSLARVMKRLQTRLKKEEEELAKTERKLKQLRVQQSKNLKALKAVREKMLQPPVEKRVAPRKPPVVRPKPKPTRRRRRRRRRNKKPKGPPPLTAAQRREIERKQEREQRLEQLAQSLLRLTFSRYRMESIYLRVYKQEEERKREVHQQLIHIYRFTLYQVQRLHQLYAAKAKGGLLHLKPFQADRALLAAVTAHTTQLMTSSLKQASGLSAITWNKATAFREESGLLAMVFVFLVPFLLLLCGVYVRRRLHRLIDTLSTRVKEAANPQVWELLRLAARISHLLVLWGALWLGLLFVFQMFQLPQGWTQMLWTVGLTILSLRALWVLANQLLAEDPTQRILKVFDDNLTRRFRRTIKWLSGFALFYLPFLEAVRVLQYPAAFYDLLNAGFYTVVWLGAVASFLGRSPAPVAASPDEASSGHPEASNEDDDALPEGEEDERSEAERLAARLPTEMERRPIEPPPENKGRLSLILGYRVYPVILACVTVIFGIYLYGWRNLAGYLGRAFFLTLFLVSISSTLYQGLRALVFWFFGVEKGGKGVVTVGPQIASTIARFSRIGIGLILAFFTSGLILEAWQVPGGFQAIIKLLNYPILNVKGSRLSLLSIVKFVAVFGFALWFSRYLQKKLEESVYPMFRFDPGSVHAANTIVGYLVIIIGVLAGLQVMGMSIGVLAVFAGVVGIGVGFGLQNIASNFISGLLITFGRPVAVGDVIEVNGVTGMVRKISARSLTIETIDSRVILIPNAQIIGDQVINWSLGPPYVKARMTVGVEQNSDVDKVEAILSEVARKHQDVLEDPTPSVMFNEFGENSLDFALDVAIRNPMEADLILSQLRFMTYQAFSVQGVVLSTTEPDGDKGGE